jgi:hypothetical protein
MLGLRPPMTCRSHATVAVLTRRKLSVRGWPTSPPDARLPAGMPTPDGPSHDLPRLIEVLDQHGVEYLVCGGAAAQAYGAGRPTEDADCVVKRERANHPKGREALPELRAIRDRQTSA